MATLAEQRKACVVIGAGGAGFPTGVKAASRSEFVIANGAECEPYITCDDLLMRERPEEVVAGARIMRHALNARRVVIGIEDNKPEAIAAMQQACAGTGIEVVSVPTLYPTGGDVRVLGHVPPKRERDYLRRMRRLASDKPDDFAILTTDTFLDLWKQISSGIFIVMLAVGSVALLVGGIGVMNIMLVSVTERTREIGLLRAVGATGAQIRTMVRWEAVLTATLGTGTGAVLGLFLGWALVTSVKVTSAGAPGATGVVSVPWPQVAAILLIGVAAGLLAGASPARRAARLDPLTAIAVN